MASRPTPYPLAPEPTVMQVADDVVGAIRSVHALDAALDAYLKHDADNVRVRFLSRRRAYEVTVLLDAAALVEGGLASSRS